MPKVSRCAPSTSSPAQDNATLAPLIDQLAILPLSVRLGSFGHEQADAAAYASWGVDFLKDDNCAWHAGEASVNDTQAFVAMRDALNATGRPIVYR